MKDESDMKEIKVGVNEYKKATAPDILDSGGLGPCIAVGAIYGKKGYMVHWVPGTILEELDKLLKDLKKGVKDLSKLDIYIAGGGIDPDEEDEEEEKIVLEERELCLEKIADAGFSENIRKVQWAKNASKPNSYQCLTLLLSENKAVYEEEFDENFEEYYDDGVRK